MAQQIFRQAYIWRRDLQLNPHVLYLFGDNELRKGLGGQAKEMRNEPNAVGVRTKRAPGMAYEDFWHDKDPDELIRQVQMIDEDLIKVCLHLQRGGLVCIPADGLGTGLSKMDKYCPETKKYLELCLRNLTMHQKP